MYNVMDDFQAGRKARQSAEEQNYINARRTVEDPYKDAELKRVDDARRALVARGVEFGDPTAARTVQTTQFEAQEQPGKMKQQAANLASTETSTAATQASTTKLVGEEERAAALRGIDAMEALNPQNPADLAQRFTPAMAAQLGINPQKFPQLLEMAGQFPDMPTFFKSMRDGFMGQEKVTSTVSGYDDQGNPITRAIGDRQKPGNLEGFVPVDEALRAQNARMNEATIGATNALANQRNTPRAGTGKALSPEAKAQQQVRLDTLISGIEGKIAEGAREGYLMSEDQDLFTQTGAWLANGIPLLSEGVQNIADPKAQVLRDGIKSGVAALLREYVAAMGIGVGSISSNFELQNVQQIINNAGSNAQAQMAAMQQVRSLLMDPVFEQRVLAAEGAAQAAAPQQAAPSVAPDRRADLASRYDLGGTD